MRIIWTRDRFEVEGKDTYDHRETLKSCGFKWDPENKTWYCLPEAQRLLGLRPLQPTITPEAKSRFDQFEAARKQNVEASRATDSDLDIPCPPGLSYLPYQKAGIAFAMRVFGDLK